MKKLLLPLLLALGSLGALAQPGRTPALQAATPQSVGMSDAGLQRIDQLLREYTATGREPGAIGFIARDGKIVYRQAFGLSDVAARTPLSSEAIVRIASQTKAITSVGAMLLFDQGRFKLDDPISKYLPAFAHPKVLATFNEKDSTYTTVPARAEITIRQLFTHTSGIGYPVIGSKEARAIYAKAHIPSGVGTPTGTLAAAIDALGPLPLMHEPGEKFTYGLSIDVLGRLIEVLSGQPLDQYLRARIFEPLGMRDTYFYLPAALQPRLVGLYTEDAAKNTVPLVQLGGLRADYPKVPGTYFSGGGGLSSTIDDYAIFLQMLLNGGEYRGRRFLKPETVALMTQNQMGAVSQGGNKFGLGFSIVTAAGAAQSGLTEGSYEWGGIFGTTYWVDPKEKIIALLYTQKWPNTTAADFSAKFKRLVYEAILRRHAPQ
ncbi:serine hydrolase domain-containing protein [Hymenobacter coccineus]|uniref:Serine hydrolase n=1 Tax=Hymenobacter coccineus TaxID=1908235 RepID=A0A1G1T220_9BACT|nr:serine hydrolase domain-containing protein [Hymenobacter coccineus]OGX84919.1 serine hydrolase [Hymenobacter coccineus]